jgi:hypothetical protein
MAGNTLEKSALDAASLNPLEFSSGFHDGNDPAGVNRPPDHRQIIPPSSGR